MLAHPLTCFWVSWIYHHCYTQWLTKFSYFLTFPLPRLPPLSLKLPPPRLLLLPPLLEPPFPFNELSTLLSHPLLGESSILAALPHTNPDDDDGCYYWISPSSMLLEADAHELLTGSSLDYAPHNDWFLGDSCLGGCSTLLPQADPSSLS